LVLEFALFATDVARIAEVDVSLGIERQVVGAIEHLVLVLVGERLDLAVFSDTDAPIAAGVRSLASDQSTLAVELQPVRSPGRIAEHRRFAGRWVVFHNPIADIAEVNAAVGSLARAFGEFSFEPKPLDLGVIGNELGFISACNRWKQQ